MTATLSPAWRSARRSSQASWFPFSARSRLRTVSAGRSPFSKPTAIRSGSSWARLAISRAKTASSCSGCMCPRASAHEHVDGARSRVGSDPAASVLRQRHPGLRYLTLVAPPLELPGELDDLGRPGRPDRMAAREQAAAWIDRQPASQPGLPVQDQALRFAGAAQPELFIELELGNGGGVMELDDVQVVRPEPGLFISQSSGPRDGVRPRAVVAPS